MSKSLPIFLCPTDSKKTLVIRAQNCAEAIEQACNYLSNGWQKHETLDAITKENRFYLLSRARHRDRAKLPRHFTGDDGYIYI